MQLFHSLLPGLTRYNFDCGCSGRGNSILAITTPLPPKRIIFEKEGVHLNSLATLAEILFEAAQSGVGCLASKCSQCLTLYFAENGQLKGSVGYLVSS